eukprot:368273_1
MAEQTNYIGLYSQLINMRFDEECALIAAQKCKNINEAIEWIHNNGNISQNNGNNNNEEMKRMNTRNCECNGQNITDCMALKRMISMLQFYAKNSSNYNEINTFLSKYKQFLVTDFHHLFDEHLNEDKMSKTESNKRFELIYKMIENNNLFCDIKKCNIYQRNNRKKK